MNNLACPRCGKTLEFSGDKPRFCAYCGASLAETTTPFSPAPLAEAATMPPHLGVPSSQEDTPEQVGHYRLVRKLGGGGMGTVHEAIDLSNGRHVALKLIAREYAASPDAVERFRQEGRLASAISHPRCVFVLAADELNGRPYIVMELMPGKTLQDLLDERGPLPVGEAVRHTLDIIEGLQEAHRLDVIHRDVKPSNCFLDGERRVKVGDFGLSKSLTCNSNMTRTGAFMGTLLFAAPEQVRGDKVDRQTDIYAVVATLYSLLANRAPFQTGDPAATLARIVVDDPPPIRDSRPDVPATLERVLLRGLSRARAARHHDLDELRRDLLPFAPGEALTAPLGARFLASVIDFILNTGVCYIFIYSVIAYLTGSGWNVLNPAHAAQPFVTLGFPVLVILYYVICEGLGDASVGKRLMGLRVRTTTHERPGLGRGVVRTLVYYILSHLGGLVGNTMILTLISPEVRADPFRLSRDPMFMIMGLSQWVFLPLQWALLLAPMRRRNGFRGLHEWASQTRVIALPHGKEQLPLPKGSLDQACKDEGGFPTNLGNFRVRGRLRQSEGQSILLAADPSLARPVLLWARPRSSPPLPEVRQNLTRATRLRWLGSGETGDLRWDALTAPIGCSLTDWVKAVGPLPWTRVHSLLEQLTTELCAAFQEGTLPADLTPEQVWVDDSGRILLVESPRMNFPISGSVSGEDGRVLTFLSKVTRLALEGPNLGQSLQSGPLNAIVPLSARPVLDRLVRAQNPYSSLASWKDALTALKELPQEVSAARRAGHVGLQLAFLSLPLFFIFVIGVVNATITGVLRLEKSLHEQSLDALRQTEWREFVGNTLASGTSSPSFVQSVAQLHADEDLITKGEKGLFRRVETLEKRESFLTPVGRFFADVAERSQGPRIEQANQELTTTMDSTRQRRIVAVNLQRRGDPDPRNIAHRLCFLLLIPPGFSLIWTFLWRGNLSSLLMRVDLVGRDGQRAGRFRILWRSFLVWLPFMGLLICSILLETLAWEQVMTRGSGSVALALSSWTWWLGWLLLPLGVGLALWKPRRGPHDVLAGTWLVPR